MNQESISQSSIATEKEDCDVLFQPKILPGKQDFRLSS